MDEPPTGLLPELGCHLLAEHVDDLAAALTVIRRLINQARNLYRWPTRPATRRLR